MRVETQPAFVLHSRRYRDTSLILELWTEDYGRVAAVARGARKPGRRVQQIYMQPFVPLLVSWTGKGSLKTLAAREVLGQAVELSGACLYSGMYINELLVRLLPHEDPHPELYYRYRDVLRTLATAADLEPVLRSFELALLDELGYGIELSLDAESGEPIERTGHY